MPASNHCRLVRLRQSFFFVLSRSILLPSNWPNTKSFKAFKFDAFTTLILAFRHEQTYILHDFMLQFSLCSSLLSLFTASRKWKYFLPSGICRHLCFLSTSMWKSLLEKENVSWNIHSVNLSSLPFSCFLLQLSLHHMFMNRH